MAPSVAKQLKKSTAGNERQMQAWVLLINPNLREGLLLLLVVVKDWICKKSIRLRLKTMAETVLVIVLIEGLKLIQRKIKTRRGGNRKIRLINKI